MKFDKYHDVAQPFRVGERKKESGKAFMQQLVEESRVAGEIYFLPAWLWKEVGSVNVIAVECS